MPLLNLRLLYKNYKISNLAHDINHSPSCHYSQSSFFVIPSCTRCTKLTSRQTLPLPLSCNYFSWLTSLLLHSHNRNFIAPPRRWNPRKLLLLLLSLSDCPNTTSPLFRSAIYGGISTPLFFFFLLLLFFVYFSSSPILRIGNPSNLFAHSSSSLFISFPYLWFFILFEQSPLSSTKTPILHFVNHRNYSS